MKQELIGIISELIREIIEVTDYLYQQKLSEGYKRLDNLIGHIMTVVDKLFLYKSTMGLQYNENKLIEALSAAMKAIEEKDSVLLADILSLEISEQLEEITRRI